jgi:hypothetical protein
MLDIAAALASERVSPASPSPAARHAASAGPPGSSRQGPIASVSTLSRYGGGAGGPGSQAAGSRRGSSAGVGGMSRAGSMVGGWETQAVGKVVWEGVRVSGRACLGWARKRLQLEGRRGQRRRKRAVAGFLGRGLRAASRLRGGTGLGLYGSSCAGLHGHGGAGHLPPCPPPLQALAADAAAAAAAAGPSGGDAPPPGYLAAAPSPLVSPATGATPFISPSTSVDGQGPGGAAAPLAAGSAPHGSPAGGGKGSALPRLRAKLAKKLAVRRRVLCGAGACRVWLFGAGLSCDGLGSPAQVREGFCTTCVTPPTSGDRAAAAQDL